MPLWNMDTEAIEETHKAILSNPNIIAVNAYDKYAFISGMKKEISATKTVPAPLDKPFAIKETDKNVRSVQFDILFQGKNAGKVELFYTEEFINKEIFRKNTALIISFIFIAFSVITGIFLVVKQTLINPVLVLSDVSKKISDNRDYSIRVEKKTVDEIGILYDNFNDMVDNIERSGKDLSKMKNFLTNIIESMPSMLISVDERGIVTQWNHAAETATSINATDIIGKKITDLIPALTDYIDKSRQDANNNTPSYFYRQRLIGKHRLNNISIYPLIENGIKGLVLRIDDVTEMEQKDEQLRQAQKMEIVGTLAGGLAHDFNNVLGGIVGTISILKFRLNKGLDISIQTMKDYVETIERAGQRAADMVQQLLTLSRKKELSFAPVDLNLTIKHVSKICSNTIDKSVEIKPCYTKDPAMVSADPGQMEQVLLNLCVNAGHAMTFMRKPEEHLGGVLTIALKSLQADNYFCSNHPEAQEIYYWVLSVQDTGTGMDSKTVAKIFDPFFTTKEKGKGTGLGLSMVYNIVQQHKGFIDVYSEVGHGTTFSVYLPSIEAVQENSVCPEELKLTHGEGLILVVDDEAIMRELAQEILTECGYQVLLAENGEEGVDVFRKEHERISMVLLDMVMPKKSGKEAFIEMKNIDPKVKVLLASGFRQDSRVEDIMKIGLSGFIQKPYTIERLSEAIRETIKA
jgi:PAS domain S-box-containing protein